MVEISALTEIETWECLQARLFHLGWLGEELPAFVTGTTIGSGGAWLYREIAREAATVARIAAAYLAECARLTASTRTGTQRDGAGRDAAGRGRRSQRDGGGAA